MKMLLHIPLVAILTVFLCGTANSARAQGLAGFGEDMLFVADTNVIGPGGTRMSLCHLTEGFKLFGMPVSFRVTGYALAPDRCQGSQYRALTPEEVVDLQASYRIPGDVPAIPRTPVWAKVWNIALWPLLFMLVGVPVLTRLRRNLRASRNSPQSRVTHEQVTAQLLATVTQVAVADQSPSAAAYGTIAYLLNERTGRTIPERQIAQLIAETKPDMSIVASLGDGLDPIARRELLDAAKLVDVALGKPSEARQTLMQLLRTSLTPPVTP